MVRVVEHELHVAVPLLPRRDGVAADGVHVDVDGQQVVAALGARLERDVEEVAGVQPLALQPALHVGEGDHDGVDLAPSIRCAQCSSVRYGRCAACSSFRRALISPPARAAARPCRRSAPPSPGGPGRAAGEDRGDERACWAVGVRDVGAARGSREHLVQGRLHRGHRLDARGDPVSEAMVRWNRESACRWRPAGGARDRLVGGARGALGRGRRARAGRERGGAGLDDAPVVEGVEPVGPRAARARPQRGRRAPGLQRHDRAAAAAARGLDQSGRRAAPPSPRAASPARPPAARPAPAPAGSVVPSG